MYMDITKGSRHDALPRRKLVRHTENMLAFHELIPAMQ